MPTKWAQNHKPSVNSQELDSWSEKEPSANFLKKRELCVGLSTQRAEVCCVCTCVCVHMMCHACWLHVQAHSVVLYSLYNTTVPFLCEHVSVLSGDAPLDSPLHYPAVSASRRRWCCFKGHERSWCDWPSLLPKLNTHLERVWHYFLISLCCHGCFWSV